jgi:hypothetical protein
LTCAKAPLTKPRQSKDATNSLIGEYAGCNTVLK